MSLEEYNKIVMKENGASHYSEILESSYYYEGQFQKKELYTIIFLTWRRIENMS